MDIPRATLPKALDIPQIYFRPPTADVPAYKPMIVPPADLERPKETEAEETTEEPVAPTLKIPVIDIKMPIPETAVVVTAVTTAVIAVTTTTITQSLFEPIKKKVQKQLQAKVNKWKENRKKKKESSES
jgi:sortase (surface protein transpeptidase)